ncbi:hypothetical protein AJ79_08762 [Helicocarpus griseus UAMH5409]|uniref:Alpha box domain-containing protein n=1 Tax=Helicocarpus griseus UAMH5409 TaxID=1447875 RepID=A0A2B7WQM0_9EURO|nr:hypothetical protein AJ79_08762 [Helicocarpus griseus UAMH5409]
MAANKVSAVHQAFNKLFTTLTPDQVQNFHAFLQEATVSNTNAVSNTPAAMSSGNQQPAGLPNVTGAAPMAPPVPSNAVTRTSHSRGKRLRALGKLRPLNSFIAFRSFYSTAFPGLSQKIKSGVLRLLWTSDPFKAKWAILARAYSIIRDSHFDQVELESFLALIVPLIGIIAPSDYLRVMGLQLVVDMDKQFSITKTDHNIELTQEDLTTNLSVDDIVAHCYQSGYVTGIFSPNNSNQGFQSANYC